MLIGLKEYNCFINCTAVQLVIFQKQTKWRIGIQYLNTNEIALEELEAKRGTK